MEAIVSFHTQKLQFTIGFVGRMSLKFELTFNTEKDIEQVDLNALYEQCIHQINEGEAELRDMPLPVIANWLAKALFEAYGVGVTVEVWREAEGATATYGVQQWESLTGEMVDDKIDEECSGEDIGGSA